MNKTRAMYPFLLIFSLSVFLFSSRTFAETITSGDYQYSLVEEYTDTGVVMKPSVFTYLGNEPSVTVPATIDGYKVKSISFYNSSAENVVISSGIEKATFRDCYSLRNISLPSSIKNLDNAFWGCKSLTEITLPSGTYSCEGAFMGCESLEKVTVNGILTNASNMFNGCSNLDKFTLNGKINGSIAYMFGSNRLSSIILNGTMTGSPLLTDNDSVKDITVNGNYADVSYIARACSMLETVTVNGNISGNPGLYECMSLKKVIVNGEVTTDDYMTVTERCPNVETVEIKKKVNNTTLCASFSESKKLKSFTVPEGVVSLLETFEKCINLETVYIPKTVTRMRDAFNYCYGLKDVYYAGSQCQWDAIEKVIYLDGDKLSQAKIHFADTLKGHSFGDWIITTDPTIYDTGTKERICSLCGEKETATIPKLTPVLTIGKKSIKLAKTKSAALKVTFTYGDSVNVKSSNKKIASAVYKNGKITIKALKKSGTAKITVTTKTGKKAVIKVTVPKAKTTKITCKKVSVKKGKKVTLKPKVTPSYSDDKVTYKSANKKIATVNSKGVVKGVKKGKTTITIKSGKKSVKVKVTVK